MRFIAQENRIVAVKHQFEDTILLKKIPLIPQPPINQSFPFDPGLQQLLTGKQLLLDDIPSYTLEQIQSHYENGYISYRKGIDSIGIKSRCVRCANTELQWFASFPCARCGETCLYCRKCLMMGRISACTLLIGWNGPPPQIQLPDRILEWQGRLSEGQKTASERVTDAIQNNEDHLVWAVCIANNENGKINNRNSRLLR